MLSPSFTKYILGFSIAPGNNWVLEVGREYAITVNIFDKMNHRVIVTEVRMSLCVEIGVLDMLLLSIPHTHPPTHTHTHTECSSQYRTPVYIPPVTFLVT